MGTRNEKEVAAVAPSRGPGLKETERSGEKTTAVLRPSAGICLLTKNCPRGEMKASIVRAMTPPPVPVLVETRRSQGTRKSSAPRGAREEIKW